jgi:DNA-binding response OmpR family regulator
MTSTKTDASRAVLWVLEDDPDIATILVEVATGMGFTVVVHTTLAEARHALSRVIATLGDPPAGVISDIELPDGRGDAWLLALRRTWAAMPLLCHSGKAHLSASRDLTAAGVVLVEKGGHDSWRRIRAFLRRLSTAAMSS